MGAVDTPVRSSGGTKHGIGVHRKRRVGIRIDMTPMVDVAFLLLIFFMVTTVFRTPKALEVNLPPDKSVPVPKTSTLLIRILADGRLFWQDGATHGPWAQASIGELKTVLAPYAGDSGKIVVVKIDREAEFGTMVTMLDDLHAARLGRFSIRPLTEDEKAEVRGH